MFIIVAGNPMDGIHFFGPFKTGEAAGDWAESYFDNDTWWIDNVTAPPEA